MQQQSTTSENSANSAEATKTESAAGTPITITVGDATFEATLADTPAASTFATMLPVTYHMSELNGNEKYYQTDSTFPTEGQSVPATVNAGDIMLYQDDYVVVFYETHANGTYAYVPLGTISDPAGLADAVGSGALDITFQKQ